MYRESVKRPSAREKIAVPALVFLVALAAYGVAGMLGAQRGIFSSSARPFTLIASTCFILISVVGGAFNSKYGILIFLGLVFCWMGDMFGPVKFIYGLIFFLMAHCLFIGAFCARGLSFRRMVPALLVYLLVGSLIATWLLPYVKAKNMLLPVLAYMTVISVMAILAFGLRERRGYLTTTLGATSFYISDIFVARHEYVIHELLNSYSCYPLYYAGCILLGLSVYFTSREPAK